MDKIFDNLKDPSWWFTAVFIAIIASLIAAYFKDLINNILSSVSGRYRKWRNIREEKNNAEAKVISNDPTLLLLSFLKVILSAIGFVFFSFSFIVYPMWAEAMLSSPNFASWMLGSPSTVILQAKIFIVGIGLFLCVLIFRTQSQTSIFKKAYRLYMQKNIARQKLSSEKIDASGMPSSKETDKEETKDG